MINPKIFYCFKIALKWEIIIICASFAFIMPWHSAHAAMENDWNGDYYLVSDPQAFCQARGAISWYSGQQNCLVQTAPSVIRRYPEGRRVSALGTGCSPTKPNCNQYDENDNPITIDGQPYTPPAPDIETCTRTSFPINTGPNSNRGFPGLSDTWTDSDGCQYSIDFDSGDAGEIILGCSSYPDSPNPEDIWCEYKTKPVGTVPPPTEENPDAPPTPPENQQSGAPTPIQEDTKEDLLVDWESWEPNPPHHDEFIDPNKVVTITLPDGGTVDVTIAPDGTISIDYGDYSPNEVPIIPGPNGYPQPNPGYSPPGGGSPGGNGPSGGSPDGPTGVPGVGGGNTGNPGGGNGDGDGDTTSGTCGILPDFICDWLKPIDLPTDNPEVPFLDTEEQYYDSTIDSNASCPPPVQMSVPILNKTYELTYDYACQLAQAIRPFVILSAYLLSGFILIGSIRG